MNGGTYKTERPQTRNLLIFHTLSPPPPNNTTIIISSSSNPQSTTGLSICSSIAKTSSFERVLRSRGDVVFFLRFQAVPITLVINLHTVLLVFMLCLFCACNDSSARSPQSMPADIKLYCTKG